MSAGKVDVLAVLSAEGQKIGFVRGSDERGWCFHPLFQRHTSRKAHPTKDAAVRIKGVTFVPDAALARVQP